jgi:hypothetical protein
MAMQVFKQRAVAIIQPTRHEALSENQEDSLSTSIYLQPPPQAVGFHCNKVSSGLNPHEQHVSSSPHRRVGIEFDKQTASPTQSLLLSQSPPSPISLFQHHLLLHFKNDVLEAKSDAACVADVHVISAAMLYNMGLLCHMYAYVHNRSNHDAVPKTTGIIRALRMYELLIELCNQWNSVYAEHSQNQTDRIIQIIQLMAYNNYAGICYELGNYVKYKKIMDVLQHQLALSLSCTVNYRVDFTGSGSDNIYNELKLNVFIYKLFSTPKLASAA